MDKDILPDARTQTATVKPGDFQTATQSHFSHIVVC